MEIYVKQGQSLFDVAVEHCGSVSATIDIAMKNEISITDALQTAQKLTIADVFGNRIAERFANLANKPATAISRSDERNLCDEVGDNTADFGTFDYTFNDSFYK